MTVFLTCWLMSLLSMAAIDRHLGARAQVLNAWSLYQRLRRQLPEAGPSRVYAATGNVGEAIAVLLVTLSSGALISSIIHWL